MTEQTSPEPPTAAAESVTVDAVTTVTPELVAAVGRLVPQLSSRAAPPTADELTAVAASPGQTLFVSRTASGDRSVVGMLTLVIYRIPTGLRAVIEDVVVDESARGAGAGAALMSAAIGAAREAGAHEVDLTSRPSREAANRLYSRMGFELRDTNVYRYNRS